VESVDARKAGFHAFRGDRRCWSMTYLEKHVIDLLDAEVRNFGMNIKERTNSAEYKML